jgi:hypothetical protein
MKLNNNQLKLILSAVVDYQASLSSSITLLQDAEGEEYNKGFNLLHDEHVEAESVCKIIRLELGTPIPTDIKETKEVTHD